MRGKFFLSLVYKALILRDFLTKRINLIYWGNLFNEGDSDASKTRNEAPVVKDTLTTLIETFLRAQDVKETSRGTYRKGLQRFMAWIAGQGVKDLTREHILAFKGYLEAQGLSSSTLSVYLVAVRNFSNGLRLEALPEHSKGDKGS